MPSTTETKSHQKISAEIEAIRGLLSRLRGRIASRRLSHAPGDSENIDSFSILDQLGDKLAAISREIRGLRSDVKILERRLENAEREAFAFVRRYLEPQTKSSNAP